MPLILATMEYKTCTSCGKSKPEIDFYIRGGNRTGRMTECKICNNKRSNEYYYRNKDKWLRYREIHGEARRKTRKQKRHENRLKVLQHYSNSDIPFCACCGEKHIEFLTIDHIHNDGAEHRKELKKINKSIAKWLIDNNYPSGFRILCFNCNMSYGIYGYCPHEEEKI